MTTFVSLHVAEGCIFAITCQSLQQLSELTASTNTHLISVVQLPNGLRTNSPGGAGRSEATRSRQQLDPEGQWAVARTPRTRGQGRRWCFSARSRLGMRRTKGRWTWRDRMARAGEVQQRITRAAPLVAEGKCMLAAAVHSSPPPAGRRSWGREGIRSAADRRRSTEGVRSPEGRRTRVRKATLRTRRAGMEGRKTALSGRADRQRVM
mmetsp:Transcript_45976/g.114069  ORF Transcript_45976/g.114069 Transcript_45976/m.114069 type:complete len:208 (-) Transcript_45976:1114-1737(-)